MDTKIINSSTSPPSSSSSPSHEFSFTISLHSSDNKTKSPPSIAIDLSPADDIFFHGHLLPLHLLSYLPVSPRSSTNSLDSFSLPIKDLVYDQNSGQSSTSNSSVDTNTKRVDTETKRRKKIKSFSLFGLGKSQKAREDDKEEKQTKKKMRFDLLKRYARLVRPFLLFRGRRENLHLRRQPYSFSGNLSGLRNKCELRGRRGEYSAPVSMRTSPTNSGLLVATAPPVASAASDSTMEELQAAIQAAIAHCKKSIGVEEKLN